MILKHMDDKTPVIAELEGLLAKASGDKRSQIEQELRTVRAGIKGEQESAYLIDFDFKEKKNSIVIHDLRLEHRGRVAQMKRLRCLTNGLQVAPSPWRTSVLAMST